MSTNSALEALDRSQCQALLASQAVGRLVFCADGVPSARPVNFALHEGDIVMRLGRSRWVEQLDRAVVAFEVDQIDQTTRTGWSVLVVGKARLVTDVDELVELIDPHRRPWAPGVRDQVVRVSLEQITGRRISRD